MFWSVAVIYGRLIVEIIREIISVDKLQFSAVMGMRLENGNFFDKMGNRENFGKMG